MQSRLYNIIFLGHPDYEAIERPGFGVVAERCGEVFRYFNSRYRKYMETVFIMPDEFEMAKRAKVMESMLRGQHQIIDMDIPTEIAAEHATLWEKESQDDRIAKIAIPLKFWTIR